MTAHTYQRKVLSLNYGTPHTHTSQRNWSCQKHIFREDMWKWMLQPPTSHWVGLNETFLGAWSLRAWRETHDFAASVLNSRLLRA